MKNLSTGRGLANGSRAVVVRFAAPSGVRLPVLRFTSGLEEIIRREKIRIIIIVNRIPSSCMSRSANIIASLLHLEKEIH